jgi:hypothetical protein
MRVRAQTFGSRLAGVADCPSCTERLELSFESTDLGFTLDEPSADVGADADADDAQDARDASRSHVAVLDEVEVRFRLPDSRDLAATAGAIDPAGARDLLLRRCVLLVTDRRDGTPRPVEALDEGSIAALTARMAEADPHAEIVLTMACPACGHRWGIDLDIPSFFWSEIVAEARRLLHEVHTLARAYGWSERDILALGATRRHAYLELAAG